MPETTPEQAKTHVNEYINKQDDKNKIILSELRNIILSFDPQITEEYKWRMPTYAKNGLMIYLRASKNHATLGFYNGYKMADPEKILIGEENPKMRHIKIKTPADLNKKLITELVKRSMEANC